jgi:hypothetical protein
LIALASYRLLSILVAIEKTFSQFKSEKDRICLKSGKMQKIGYEPVKKRYKKLSKEVERDNF